MARAINPYLAFETLDDMLRQGQLTGLDHDKAVKNYIKATNKGVVRSCRRWAFPRCKAIAAPNL